MTKDLEFKPVGNYGVEAAIDGDHVLLRLPNGRDKAKPVPDGKTYAMVSSTGGWTNIPGSEVRLSLNAGFKCFDVTAAVPPIMAYSVENVRSTVCSAGTDFEHNVYWLDNGIAEGQPGYRFRYLSEDEKALYEAEKPAFDASAAERRAATMAANR